MTPKDNKIKYKRSRRSTRIYINTEKIKKTSLLVKLMEIY